MTSVAKFDLVQIDQIGNLGYDQSDDIKVNSHLVINHNEKDNYKEWENILLNQSFL